MFIVYLKLKSVLRIRIRWSRMFSGLLDPFPDPLVTRKDPDPYPLLRKTFTSTGLWLIYDFLSLKNYVSVPDPDPYVFGPLGSASGSVSQRYGCEDPDLQPDPYQNVTDPQHCLKFEPLHRDTNFWNDISHITKNTFCLSMKGKFKLVNPSRTLILNE